MKQGITGYAVKEIEVNLKYTMHIGPFYETVIFKFIFYFSYAGDKLDKLF
jgi:hypothetical protein